MTVFETDRLIVRTQHYTDADNYFRLHGDPEVVKYIRAPKTREACDEFLAQHLEQNKTLYPLGRFLVEEKHSLNFVGAFVIIPVDQTDSFQMGYALIKEAWGKGYATELVLAGLRYFSENSMLPIIYGITEAANIPSQNVLLKCGFTFEEEKQQGDALLRVYSKKRINNG